MLRFVAVPLLLLLKIGLQQIKFFVYEYMYKMLSGSLYNHFHSFYGGKILLKLRRNNFLRGEMGEKYGKLSAKLLKIYLR
jgi:hypothetical protein